MKKVMSILAVLVALIALTACGGSKEEGSSSAAKETEKKETVMGFIYVGPIGDGGWSYMQEQGRLDVEKELGIKTIYKENVPEGPEVKDIVRNMIDQGANIIMAGSFGYMDYIEEISKEFPEVKFLHCSGYKQTDNMANFFGRMYQPRYLSGLVAGLKTESNKIGYVAAFPIPEVIRGINAFTLGVKAVKPEATVEVIWTNTWYDPAKEKDAAIALLDKGADVIAQHQDTAGPQQAAQERGKFSVGYNSDMKELAPKAYMTAPIWNWGPYFISQAKAVIDGTWSTGAYWGGMKEGVVAIADLTDNAPADAAALVEKYSKEIVDGTFHVFSGEIKDQTGEIRVKEGESLSDGEMLSIDWFVEGVIGKTK